MKTNKLCVSCCFLLSLSFFEFFERKFHLSSHTVASSAPHSCAKWKTFLFYAEKDEEIRYKFLFIFTFAKPLNVKLTISRHSFNLYSPFHIATHLSPFSLHSSYVFPSFLTKKKLEWKFGPLSFSTHTDS